MKGISMKAGVETLIIALFVLLGGLFVGNFFSGFSQYSGLIVYVALIILLYSIMLTIPFWEIARSFKNIRFMGLSWIANFVFAQY